MLVLVGICKSQAYKSCCVAITNILKYVYLAQMIYLFTLLVGLSCEPICTTRSRMKYKEIYTCRNRDKRSPSI